MAIQQGFAKHHGRGGVGREVGLHQEEKFSCVGSPKTSSIYRGEGGCAPFRVSHPKVCGQGGRSASQVKWRPPPLGFPPSHAHGPWGAGSPGPLRLGRPLQPMLLYWTWWNNFRTSGPLRNPPEPSGSFPVQYRKNPNFSRNPNNNFPYINLYLRTIPELLVTSGISSETPNNIR